jgi:tetratricopeptide (TPR) repeat protein
MSPEQAAGRWDILRPASDIYSLGATLYALLTGRPPVQGSTPLEILQKVKRGEFPAPRQVKKEVPRPLEAVCLKAMALQPQDRHETALDLADDVERWLADEPVTAYREPWRVRAARWVRRRRTLVMSVGVAVVLLGLGGGAAAFWLQQQEAEHQQRLGETEKGIELAVSEATKLLDRGASEVNNPPSWGTTLAAARTATEQAETLLAREPELKEEALSQQVQQLRSRLDADVRDRGLLDAFEAASFKLSERSLHYTEADGYQDLKKALAQWGLPPSGVPVERAQSLIRQRPRAVQPHLIAVVDTCVWWGPRGEKQEGQWFAKVVDADPDPWRQRVRQAMRARDVRGLERLVSEVDVARQPVALLYAFSQSWLLEGKPAQIEFLRRIQQHYPQDFWVNYRLGWWLYQSVFPRPKAERALRPEELPAMNEAIRFYTAARALRPQSPGAHTGLGTVLRIKGDLAGADACFRQTLALDPNYVPGHNNLGATLADRHDLAAAVVCYRKALDLDPRDATAHYNLGNALSNQGDVKGAMACYRKALELDPRDTLAHYNLGNALSDLGDLPGATDCYRKALALDPTYAPAHTNLGNMLARRGELAQAMACYHKALTLDPTYAPAHTNLGTALHKQGKVKEAIICHKKALELDPKYPPAHTNLGNALYAEGDFKGAIGCYKKALALDPKFIDAHLNLGVTLQAQKDLKGAIVCYTQALKLDPRRAQVHFNLGVALFAQRDVEEAIAHYRQAIKLDPRHATALGALGEALYAQGAFAEALTATHKALELLPPGDPLRPRVTRQLQDCQQLLELEEQRSAVLKGEAQPANAFVRLRLADFCLRFKKRYREAVRFYSEAFADPPQLTPAQQTLVHYNAACAAILAAAGQGAEAVQFKGKEKARLRQQALAWLRDNLEAYAKQLEDAHAKTLKAVQQTLQHWQKDPDFECVRGKEALAKLPEAERAAWQQLWADVEKLLKKAAP